MVYFLINSLTFSQSPYLVFDVASESVQFNILNFHLIKVVGSAICNYLLYKMLPEETKLSKQKMATASFKIALWMSFLCEVLFETESKDILSVQTVLYSLLYEDLFEELSDKRTLAILEILRISSLLFFSRSLWRTFLIFSKDLVAYFILYFSKGWLFAYLSKSNQQSDFLQTQLSDRSQVIDTSSAAIFILRWSTDFIIEYKNTTAVKLGAEVMKQFEEASQLKKNLSNFDMDIGERISEAGQTKQFNQTLNTNEQVQEDKNTLTGYLHLNKTSNSSLWRKLQYYVKSMSDESEVHIGVQIFDSNQLYVAYFRPTEWLGQKRMLIELRKSNYQHVKMTYELADLLRNSVAQSERKYKEIEDFISKINVDGKPEHKRVSASLGIYNGYLSQHIRLVNGFIQALKVSAEADEGQAVFMDSIMAESMFKKLGNLVASINHTRRNSITLQISSFFAKGCMVQYSYLDKLLHYLLSFIVSSNINNKFVIKMNAKQVNDTIYQLEFTIDGFTTNSFNSEVFNILLKDDTADLLEVVESHFPYFPVTFYMVSYLRKLLHMKFKVYNGGSVRLRSEQVTDQVKTPVMYSRQ